MTEVEQSSVALFQRVFFHHCFFDFTASVGHFGKCGQIPFTDFVHIVNQPQIIGFVPDKSVLHDFGKTGKELSVIQSGQCADIHVNQLRHVESAHHVFVAVEIHTGFSANAGINLG